MKVGELIQQLQLQNHDNTVLIHLVNRPFRTDTGDILADIKEITLNEYKKVLVEI